MLLFYVWIMSKMYILVFYINRSILLNGIALKFVC